MNSFTQINVGCSGMFWRIFACVLLFSLSTSGQVSANLDSLQSLLNSSKSDAQKVSALNALSKMSWQVSDYPASLNYARKAKLLAEQTANKRGISDALMNIGVCYLFQGDYPIALQELNAALVIQREIGNKVGMANALNNIGTIYFNQGNYPEALKKQFEGLRIRESIRDKSGIAASHNNIGNIYYSLGQLDDALKEYRLSLKIREEIGDKAGIAAMHGNVGLIISDQGDLKGAMTEYQYALNLYTEIGNRDGVAGARNLIGSIYVSDSAYEKGIQQFGLALNEYRAIGNPYGEINARLDIASAWISMGDVKNCRVHLDSALALVSKLDLLPEKVTAYRLLAVADSLSGDFKSAWENDKLYFKYRDELNNEETQRKSMQEKMQYEFERKTAATNAHHEAVLTRQKLIRNGLIAGFSVLLIFLLVVFRQRNNTKREHRRAEEEKKRSDELLLNILPQEVAQELRTEGKSKAKAFTMATVMFTDFKDFTLISEKVSAELLVDEIHQCFSTFDTILQKHNIEKIKTIGDAYLCAAGIPASNLTHAEDMLNAAIEIRDFMIQRKKTAPLGSFGGFDLRIGIHTGPVVAGVVGIRKYAYDIWGDTVNIAARMEQQSEAGQINVSGVTYELVKDKFSFTYRGKVAAKNKGDIDMYFLNEA